ncbi:MAG: acyl-CoA thioesterase domain-containing protein [Pseudomonadales bacterium]
MNCPLWVVRRRASRKVSSAAGGGTTQRFTQPSSSWVTGVHVHSLHAYFLRPGRARSDIECRVTRSKEGRNFQVREVTRDADCH